MINEYQIRVLPQYSVNEQSLRHYLAKEKGMDERTIKAVRVLKKSIDARQRTVVVNLTVRVYVNEEPQDDEFRHVDYPLVDRAPRVIVVGAGPGGLFAALRLIELGFCPIVVERGKNVRDRKVDLARISREHKVNSESNYSFGEGGAGAYSDGKLYTRSKKRGNVDKILNVFCQHGASTSILSDAHPHIGTDKLPAVIEAMRNTILRCGGEVHFETRMDAIIIEQDEVIGIRTNTGKEFNVLTGTLFQGTKIDLTTWFEVIFRENSDKSGLAATTVMRDYGITYTAAWNMLHKIRNAMSKENHQELSGTVEVDEYHAGGSLKNMHYNKKLEVKQIPNQNKKLLQGFVQRNGDSVIRVIPNMLDSTLNAGILRYVEKGSSLYSDDNPSYQKLPPFYKQAMVVHSKGNYVKKDDKNVHTNTIESVWSGFKRVENIHIVISPKHTQNYANETVFRYNTRKMKSSEACIWFLQNIEDTKITWKEIRDGKYRQYNRNQKRVA